MSDIVKQTGSQTAGPYLHIGLCPNAIGLEAFGGVDLGSSPIGSQQSRIELGGSVYDGAGEPCRDALVEVYQDEGFARCPVDFESGRWSVQTVLPTSQDGLAFVSLWIVARGINRGLWSRVYFVDLPRLQEDDALGRLPSERLQTLLATPNSNGVFEHNIHLQGPSETLFFEVAGRGD